MIIDITIGIPQNEYHTIIKGMDENIVPNTGMNQKRKTTIVIVNIIGNNDPSNIYQSKNNQSVVSALLNKAIINCALKTYQKPSLNFIQIYLYVFHISL